MAQKATPSKWLGRVYFFLFVILIAGGIITKRVFGHPEYMMMWHLPAAVFLVLAGMKTTQRNRERYLADQRRLKKTLA